MDAAGGTKNSLAGVFIRYRPAFALMALALVCGVVLALQAAGLREEWLSWKSLPDLKNLASARDADMLTHVVYGEALSNDGRFPEAAAEFQRAERMLEPGRRDSTAERVHARFGYTLALMGDVDRAVSSLDRARQINNRSWLVTLGEGAVLLNKQMPKPAIAKFQNAVAERPQGYEAYYMLGVASDENSEPNAASEALQRAVSLAPKFAPAHAELGHALAYQSRFPEAIQQFRIAHQLAPQSQEYLFALGDVLGASARTPAQYGEAVDVLEACRSAAPQNADLLFTLGQLHLRFMNLDSAYQRLERTTEIRPDLIRAWYLLGRVEQLLGDEKEAAHAYAVFQKELALHDQAILAEKRVVANLSDFAARLELFRCFRATGNVMGAYTQLKAALKIRPDDSEARREMLQFQRDHTQALEPYGGTTIQQNDSDRLGPP